MAQKETISWHNILGVTNGKRTIPYDWQFYYYFHSSYKLFTFGPTTDSSVLLKIQQAGPNVLHDIEQFDDH